MAESLRDIAHPGGGDAAHAACSDELIEQGVRDGADQFEVPTSKADHLVPYREGDERLERGSERDRRAIGDETVDGLRHRHHLAARRSSGDQRPSDSMYALWLCSISVIESPPNFSRNASASVNATTASPITPAAGTTHTSLRS